MMEGYQKYKRQYFLDVYKRQEQSDAGAIFQSFYRGNNVNNHAGNGLGLYICKQLMQKMDGDIFMTQEQGSVSFHLVLGTV